MTALLSFILFLVKDSFVPHAYPDSQTIMSHLHVQGGVRLFCILYSPEHEEHVTYLQRNLELPMTINSLQKPLRHEVDFRLPCSVIMILDENMSVGFVVNNTLRSHNTIYVTVCHSTECVKPRFREFWDNKIISAFVFLSEKGAKTKILGFDPTPDDILVKETEQIKTVGTFNMHGSRINVSVVNLAPAVILDPEDDTKPGGVECLLMLVVASKFNITPYFAVPRDGEWWGWLKPIATGVVGEVLTGYSEFGFGILAILEERLMYLDQLVGYNAMECVTWAVPKAAGPTAAPWVSMLLTEFADNTWIAITLSSFMVILASLAVDRLRLGATLFRIFGSSIGSPIYMPQKASSRILMLTWVWASFILAVAYQASMGSKLAVPPTHPDINTVLDLVQSTLHITGFFNSILLIKGEDPVTQAVKKRIVPTKASISEAFKRIVIERDLAYMRQGTTFRYTAIVDPEVFEGIHIMHECAFAYYPSFTLSKWSPFYSGTLLVMRRLFESGITDLWGTLLMPQLPPLPHPITAIGTNQLLGAYALLVVGWIIAGIVFFSETLRFRGVTLFKWNRRGIETRVEIIKVPGKKLKNNNILRDEQEA